VIEKLDAQEQDKTWVNERHLDVDAETVVDHSVYEVRSESTLMVVDPRVAKRGVTPQNSTNLMVPLVDVHLL
jgi:hypothetical protein